MEDIQIMTGYEELYDHFQAAHRNFIICCVSGYYTVTISYTLEWKKQVSFTT